MMINLGAEFGSHLESGDDAVELIDILNKIPKDDFIIDFKEVLFEIFSFVMFFFIVFYLMGLVVGLAKTRNYLTYTGIKNILLPLILFSILREILRYMVQIIKVK